MYNFLILLKNANEDTDSSSLSCICTSGLGKSGIRQGCHYSHSDEQMDKITLEIVKTGDHWDIRITKQMLPLLLI